MMDSKIPEVLCYLCAVVDDGLKRERHIKFNNPAAENKVLGICHALRSRIRHVVVVSDARGTSIRHEGLFGAVARRVSKVPVLYAAFWHHRVLSHLVTLCSLILLLLRLKKLGRGKKICLMAYNRRWLYFPVLCFARMLGMHCYLDLEDAPTVRDAGAIQRLMLWLQARVIDALCNQGAMLASSLLLDKVNHRHRLVCHGVAYKRDDIFVQRLEEVKPVRILFGGFLSQETGAQLFIDAIRLLAHEHKDLCDHIRVVVTGHGPLLADIESLSLHEGKSWIEYHGDVDFAVYQSLLRQVDVGLCLKLPSSDMCSTTFPSKVVEYASFGKAVLSTGIEDVIRLFGEDGAYVLPDESVEGLVKMMRKIALESKHISAVAERGQRRLIEKSGKDAVADSVMRLLTDEMVMTR